MTLERTPITGIYELLKALYCGYNSQKTKAVLHRDHFVGDEKYFGDENYFVREYFDDGKGHSDPFTIEDTPVAKEVFEEAKKNRLIEGLLMPGYVSQDKFELSEHGQDEYFRLNAERLAKPVAK